MALVECFLDGSGGEALDGFILNNAEMGRRPEGQRGAKRGDDTGGAVTGPL